LNQALSASLKPFGANGLHQKAFVSGSLEPLGTLFRKYFSKPILARCTGIVIGRWLLGAAFTAMSMIGFIALAGIIVRNSILLVDFFRHRLADGAALRPALIEAGATRFKPIFLTAAAAIRRGFHPHRSHLSRPRDLARLRPRLLDGADPARYPGDLRLAPGRRTVWQGCALIEWRCSHFSLGLERSLAVR
jgi:hypothetical protein